MRLRGHEELFSRDEIIKNNNELIIKFLILNNSKIMSFAS